MATRPGTVAYILDQAKGAGPVAARKLFGEYALYAGDKLVALICDDRLFIKPTYAGRDFIGQVDEVSPYKGAKPCFLIPDNRLDHADWVAELVRRTAAALPMPAKQPRAPGGHCG